jgi:hypothetical protein
MKTRKTLVAIRLRPGRARELGQAVLLLIGLAVVVGFFAVLKYATCQRDHPGRAAVACFRGIPR